MMSWSLGFIHRDRLLCDGIASQLHGPDVLDVVVFVNRCGDDDAGLLLVHYLIELVIFVGIDLGSTEGFDCIVGGIHPSLVEVAEADNLSILAEILHDACVVHRGADAEPDDDISFDGRKRTRFDPGRLWE